MGLKNATATFQRMMEIVLRGATNTMVYVDDVIVYSRNMREHAVHLAEALTRLRDDGLTCKLSKCRMAARRVEFLGHEVGGGKVYMVERIVRKVVGCAPPQDKSGVRRFVGMCSYYRHFIQGFANIAGPLTSVMGKKAEWECGAEQ